MPLMRKPGTEDERGAIPASLASFWVRKEFPAGSVIFAQEDGAERCFYLERGEVALRRGTRRGSEVEVARIAEGEWFAEAVLFAGRRYPAQAVASRDSSVLEFRRADILSSADPRVASFFLELLARKCLALNARIEQLAGQDARERVAAFILGLCPGAASGCAGRRAAGSEPGGEASRGPCSFPLPKKKREIASELAMSPETLSRVLRRMEGEGYLKIDGPRVEIPSCERLRSLAED